MIPYEVLQYVGTLVLHDRRGARATFHRSQRIRFRQNGVSAILDHAWGDGILLTNYQNTAGSLGDSIKEQGRRHLVIELKRAMANGEILDFTVRRDVMEMFLEREGWVETLLDHPVQHVRRTVVFPRGRRPYHASLAVGDKVVPLPIRRRADGRSFVEVVIEKPLAHTSYTVRWTW
jgi:hypothetical protein